MLGYLFALLVRLIMHVRLPPRTHPRLAECYFSAEKGWEYTPTTEIQLGKQYKVRQGYCIGVTRAQQGHINMLLSVAQSASGTPTPKICYFGVRNPIPLRVLLTYSKDHIMYDVVVPRQTQLYAVAIIEEMVRHCPLSLIAACLSACD